METLKQSKWKLGLAVVVILALCVATAAFGQSSRANQGRSSRLSKLEPALEVLNGSNTDPNALIGVIVQFNDDEVLAGPGKTRQETRKLAKRARRQAIIDAAGRPEREFDNLPIAMARLTPGALKRLEKHPNVKRISYDIPPSAAPTPRPSPSVPTRSGPVLLPCRRLTAPGSAWRSSIPAWTSARTWSGRWSVSLTSPAM